MLVCRLLCVSSTVLEYKKSNRVAPAGSPSWYLHSGEGAFKSPNIHVIDVTVIWLKSGLLFGGMKMPYTIK